MTAMTDRTSKNRERPMKYQRFPMKSNCLPCLMNSIVRFVLRASADVELLHFAAAHGPVAHQARAHDAGEQAHEHAEEERDREPLDGACPVLPEDQAGDDRRHVAVQDGAEGLVVADVDRLARALAE